MRVNFEGLEIRHRQHQRSDRNPKETEEMEITSSHSRTILTSNGEASLEHGMVETSARRSKLVSNRVKGKLAPSAPSQKSCLTNIHT